MKVLEALCEAVRLGSPLYREPAQRGIDFLIKAQNPGYAWRYSVRSGDNDTSVTGWCLRALGSAELAGLNLPPSCYQGARTWLKRVTSLQGVVGYESPGDNGSVVPNVNDRWQVHPSMTAVGLHSKLLMDQGRNDPWLKVGAQILLKDLPLWDEARKSIDFYYWHHAALAILRFDGPEGPAWKAVETSVRNALLPSQTLKRMGCPQGSWGPAADKWGAIGGRVYSTALNVLTLELLATTK